MSQPPEGRTADQRTLNHYFASYQQPHKSFARQNALSNTPKSDKNGIKTEERQSSATPTGSSHTLKGSTASHENPKSPPSATKKPVTTASFDNDDNINNDSFKHYNSILTESNSISLQKRRKLDNEAEDDDSVIFVGEATPHPQRPFSSVHDPSAPAQCDEAATINSIAAPPTSQLSNLTSLGSTPSAASFHKSAYVPSSQSDENDDIEDSTIAVHVPSPINEHDSLSQESSDLSEPPLTNERQQQPEKQQDPYQSSDSESSDSPMEDLATILGSLRKRPLAKLNKQHDARVAANSKFSLANLKKQHDKDLSARDEMQRALAVLDETTKEPVSGTMLNKEILSSVLKPDEDETQLDKVMHAMDRTDAMGVKFTWSFFKDTDDISEPRLPEFPTLDEGFTEYAALFRDRASQCNTFFMGFAEELFANTGLPKSLADWLWTSAMLEQDESLALAYIRALKTAQVDELRSTNYIYNLFSSYLNAKPESLNLESHITPIQQNAKPLGKCQTARLLRVLLLIGELANHLSSEARMYAIGLLLRVTLDAEVTENINILLRLRDSIISLVSLLPHDRSASLLSSIGENIYQHLSDAKLEAQLITYLPSSMPQLQQLRRNLALAFFISSSAPLTPSPPDQQRGDIQQAVLITLTQSSLFQIAPDANIDYSQLASFITLLDIGIGSGFTPIPTDPAELHAAAIKSHDKTIDTLYDTLHGIMSRITDCGAAHMTRTEAKSVLERLLNRLAYAVRSRPRPRRTVWDADDNFMSANRAGGIRPKWKEGGRAMMQEFLAAKPVIAIPGEGAGREGDGDRSSSAADNEAEAEADERPMAHDTVENA